jgi:two-component system nitrate/nitrite response regulator NarL
VRKVLAGETCISPGLTLTIREPTLRRKFERGEAPRLTPRQIEILKLISSGRTDVEIAELLNITTRTVRFHRLETARKLGVSGRAALTKYAISHGLSPLE